MCGRRLEERLLPAIRINSLLSNGFWVQFANNQFVKWFLGAGSAAADGRRGDESDK
jgi:hypothetical protein